ncbi:LexA family transcriptional regulator [Streptococcus dentasini]
MFSAEKLKKRRQKLGLSQADLARQLGISRPSYFNWENGHTRPNQKNWDKLSQILQVSPSYFLSEHEIVETYVQLNQTNKKKTLDFANHLLISQGKMISEAGKQLYPYKVYERLSAGTGYTYFNDGNYDEVFYDEELDHDFASWVFGNSMEPTYLNGEVVLIKQTGFDYDGAVYAVDWDGQTYIKRVYREEGGLRLVSINQQYADKFAPYDEEPRIVGKIVGNFMPIEAQG